MIAAFIVAGWLAASPPLAILAGRFIRVGSQTTDVRASGLPGSGETHGRRFSTNPTT